MAQKVGFLEINPSGHRLMYVRLLILDAIKAGHLPTLVTTAPVVQSVEYSLHLADIEHVFGTILIDPGARLDSVQVRAREAGVSRLIISDGNVWAMDALRNHRVKPLPETRMVIMRDPRWEFAEQGRRFRAYLKWAALFALEKSRRVKLYWLREPGTNHVDERTVIDPIILDGEHGQILADSHALRARLGMDSGTFWFGVTGVLSDAKISAPVLRALAILDSEASRPIGLALVGPKAKSAEWPQMQSRFRILERAVIEDRVLSNYEVGVAIRSFDCLVATYQSVYGPSATLAKAAALGVRTVSGGPSSLREFARNITGRESVAVEAEALLMQMRLIMEEEAPAPRHYVGTEVFTRPLLEDM